MPIIIFRQYIHVSCIYKIIQRDLELNTQKTILLITKQFSNDRDNILIFFLVIKTLY